MIRESSPPAVTPDVLVIGGGAVGCATALALRKECGDLSVTVVEADSSYKQAASTAASGGVRQLFTQPENILLSQCTLRTIQDWDEFVGPGVDIDPLWNEQGYLFLVGRNESTVMRANFEGYLRHGVSAEWLSPRELKERYPMLRCDDLEGSVLSPRDGWLDPTSFLRGLRRSAIAHGTEFIEDRVIEIEKHGTCVTSIRTANGRQIRPRNVVNAAGCWAPELNAKVDMPLPVEPMRRYHHYVEGPLASKHLPFVKDSAGLAVQSWGQGFMVGLVDFSHPGGFDTPIDRDYFTRAVWPALAHRVPELERCRERWVSTGFYDQNRLDGNAILGNWPGHLDNFFVASGFSGHGLMHAIGVGRALAELIVHGEFKTIDLGRMTYQRIADNRPLAERGIK